MSAQDAIEFLKTIKHDIEYTDVDGSRTGKITTTCGCGWSMTNVVRMPVPFSDELKIAVAVTDHLMLVHAMEGGVSDEV